MVDWLERTYETPAGDIVSGQDILDGKTDVPPAWFVAFCKPQPRHDDASTPLTVTQSYSCPREAALGRLGAEPVDLGSSLPMSIGTALHAALAKGGQLIPNLVTEECSCLLGRYDHPDPSLHTEDCSYRACSLHGEIDGVEITGLLDAYSDGPDGVTLYDYKSKSPFAAKYARTDDPRLVAQMSMYAELMRQQGHGVAEARVVQFFYNRWPAPAADGKWGESVPILRIEEALKLYPDESLDYTVGQLLHMAQEARECNNVREVLAQVMPIGAGMFKGQKCQKYCQYYHVCYPQAAGGV